MEFDKKQGKKTGVRRQGVHWGVKHGKRGVLNPEKKGWKQNRVLPE